MSIAIIGIVSIACFIIATTVGIIMAGIWIAECIRYMKEDHPWEDEV